MKRNDKEKKRHERWKEQRLFKRQSLETNIKYENVQHQKNDMKSENDRYLRNDIKGTDDKDVKNVSYKQHKLSK